MQNLIQKLLLNFGISSFAAFAKIDFFLPVFQIDLLKQHAVFCYENNITLIFRVSANNKKKECRVLFSYQPKHEDELKLEMDDVVDFVAEVEDGWWKGTYKVQIF